MYILPRIRKTIFVMLMYAEGVVGGNWTFIYKVYYLLLLKLQVSVFVFTLTSFEMSSTEP
jgi:hypothetical protein